MIIHILQNAISIDNKYRISVNNKIDYQVEGYSYLLDSRHTLFHKKHGQLISIFRVFFGLYASFNIYFNSEMISKRRKPLKFRPRNFIRNHFYCKWDDDLYEIFAHKGLKFSIFKNGGQIAGISQDRWTSFKEDGFRMECLDDSNKELMISFTIILDAIYSRNISLLYGLFTFNYGVFCEKRPYNDSWTSK